MRLRMALAKSKNMVSIRLLQAIGPTPRTTSRSSVSSQSCTRPISRWRSAPTPATPLQMAGAYATFANGGYRVKPWFVTKIVDNHGELLYEAKPEVAGTDAERVLDPRNAFLMTSMMKDVVRAGTATRAMSLGRGDLAGKTGTTNDHIDAWFAGFNPKLVAVAWIGFDTPAPLGANETGGMAALPMWMTYAGRVLKGVGEQEVETPSGVAVAGINPVTGLREADGRSKTIEYFYQESLPGSGEEGAGDAANLKKCATRSSRPAGRPSGQESISARRQPAPAHRLPRRKADGRGRGRLWHGEAEGRAPGRPPRCGPPARQPRNRIGPARVPGPLPSPWNCGAFAKLRWKVMRDSPNSARRWWVRCSTAPPASFPR